MKTILETVGLVKRFGGFLATDHVSLTVGAGEVHCLIGPNGAGKSTLIGLITGRLRQTAGEIRLGKVEVTHLKPHQRAAMGLGVKFQVPGVFSAMSVRQNLLVAHQRSRPHGVEARVEAELDGLGLQEVAGRPAGQLSHGQQQWLEIAMAVASRPHLLLLDEPTAGMSPEETCRTGELVLRLNAAGTTILAIEHDMDFVRQVATRVTVLHHGRVFLNGTFEDVTRSEEVARIYMGKA